MSTVLPSGTMTIEAFLALPQDDNVDRDLVRGEVKERPLTRRNRFHAKTEARVAYLLTAWLQTQPAPRGNIFSGEVGCILQRDPATIVGIDVAYFSAEFGLHESFPIYSGGVEILAGDHIKIS